jgi:hypothetical protein
MIIANNGAAIIGGVVVPASEVLVLRSLVQIGRPATVPEIAKAMNEVMSDASLYSLLGRLAEKRELVSRDVVYVDVCGSSLRRIQWSAHQVATAFFKGSEVVHVPKKEMRLVPAEAAG